LKQLQTEVMSMREKMRKHLDKSTENLMDIKQGQGGLVDIEFITQYLVLAHCHQYNELSEHRDNLSLFKLMAKLNIITELEQQTLADSYHLLRVLGHKATLQNEALLIDINEYQPQGVITLWQKFIVC